MLTSALSNKIKQHGLVLLLSLVCVLAVFMLVANTPYSTAQENISQGVKYVEDSTQDLDIISIQALPQHVWQQEQSDVLSFAISEHPYWLTFELAPANNRASRLLELGYARLDKVSIWFITEQEIISEYHMSDTVVFAKRPFKDEKLLLPLPHNEQATQVMVRVQSGDAMKIPMGLWFESSYRLYSGDKSIAMELFFGFMAAMALSNFLFFITTGVKTFLVYSAGVLCLTLSLAPLYGVGYTYLWPNNAWLQDQSVSLFANATIFFAVIFSDILLDLKSHSARLSNLLKASAGLFLLYLLISLFLPYALFVKGFLFMLIMVSLLIGSIGSWLWLKGVPLAVFFTLAWIGLFLSAFVASLDNLSLITLEPSYHHLLMIVASVEISVFALVLALRYRQQQQDTFDSQALALNIEREARYTQKESLDLQHSAKQELEYKVQKRTLELEIALRELSETNRELEKKNSLDALTGIRNRRYFDKKYTAEVRRSRRERTELSVVMIDIDHFKKVNDQHGHLAGDECIKFVAKILKNALKRPSDDVFRYGGEEFALVLPSTDLEGARSLIECLRQEIQDSPFVTTATSINLSISAGIASAIATAHQPDDALLALADQQLYLAKNAGRNRVLAARFVPSPHNKQDQVDV
ncbi:MAG: diguanylate cyclase (GGDEF)-like protein [Paraglaciecola sp.]|jgi:diguanylate cyclase (GGDEF)-like protein